MSVNVFTAAAKKSTAVLLPFSITLSPCFQIDIDFDRFTIHGCWFKRPLSHYL